MEKIVMINEYDWNYSVSAKLYDKLILKDKKTALIYDEEFLSISLLEFLWKADDWPYTTLIPLSMHATYYDVENAINQCTKNQIEEIYAFGRNDILESAKYISIVIFNKIELYHVLFNNITFNSALPTSLYKIDEKEEKI